MLRDGGRLFAQVRALKPESVVVLREGERALVQARLVDADGKGVPSSERLLRAVLCTTPATEPKLAAAVRLQREGASEPEQQGRTPPTTLQKREAARFMQGLAEHAGAVRAQEAKRAQEAAATQVEAELASGDAVDESAVLPAGSKRAAYAAVMAEYEDYEEGPLEAYLDGNDDSDSSYVEGGGGGRSQNEEEDEEEEEELSGMELSDEEEEEEEGEGGAVGGKRKRRSKRAAAKVSRQTISAVIAAATERAAGGAAGAAAGAAGGAAGELTDKHRAEADALGFGLEPGVDEDEEDDDFDGGSGGSSSGGSGGSSEDEGEEEEEEEGEEDKQAAMARGGAEPGGEAEAEPEG